MLNDKEQKIYEYIRECILNYNISHTVREICREVGIPSTSTVHYYLKRLTEEGYIVKDEFKKRTIKLPSSGSITVPLLGTVTAGIPITAIEEVEDFIPVFNLRGDAKDFFALHVSGESMKNAGILDGDIVIVKKTPSCRNGEIIVALIGDEATVKRFYKDEKSFRLMPENPDFEPIIVDQLTILGRVVSLIRNY